MVIGYEADLAEARDIALDFKEQLAVKTSELAASVEKVELLQNVADEYKTRTSHLQAELEKEMNKKNAEIASLQRRLAASDQMQVSNLKKMRKDLVAKFETKVASAGSKVNVLRGEVTDNLLNLGQIDNNLQFIGEMQSGEIADLEVAKAELAKWRVPIADAEVVFNESLDGILGELVVSPISPDVDSALFGDGPIETLAGSVGVSDFAGTNETSPILDELIAEKNLVQTSKEDQEEGRSDQGQDSEGTKANVAE